MTPDVAVRLVTEAPRSGLALEIQMANFTGLWIGSPDFWAPKFGTEEWLRLTTFRGVADLMDKLGDTL